MWFLDNLEGDKLRQTGFYAATGSVIGEHESSSRIRIVLLKTQVHKSSDLPMRRMLVSEWI